MCKLIVFNQIRKTFHHFSSYFFFFVFFTVAPIILLLGCLKLFSVSLVLCSDFFRLFSLCFIYLYSFKFKYNLIYSIVQY